LKLFIKGLITVCLALAGFNEKKVEPKSQTFVATAYSLRGRTASGIYVRKGIIAADPKVLPLGTKVHIDTGHPSTTGQYIVADTGGMIKKNRIDLWIPSTKDAMKFGKRTVKLTILEYAKPKTKETAKK